LKVLFQIRGDYLSNIAGDTIILKNLQKYLIKLGVQVDVHTDIKISLSKYDVVHIFNTIRVFESFKYMEHAKFHNKKVVLTPIYWDLTNYYRANKLEIKLDEWQRSNRKRQYLFDNCDVFLPHCKIEEEIIKTNYGNRYKSIIVPYGVETSYIKGDPKIIKYKYNIDRYILCVARISTQKNQLNLIKSLLHEDIPLILTGQINERDYLRGCIEAGYSKLLIIERLEQGELQALYKGANVHILPSWYEYPGLANLEAGIAGCNVVTTEIGTTKEVLRDYVLYCDPNDITSIHNQTMKAYETEKKDHLSNFILENYTWEKIAHQLKTIYKGL